MSRKALSNLLAITGVTLALAITVGGTLLFGRTLLVDVSGLRSSDGVVHVIVYDNASAFDRNSVTDIVGFATQEVSADPLRVAVRGLSPGRYALMVHHDENANDVFEVRGDVPVEGWGYSNNVGQVNIPSFAAAAVTFGEQSEPFEITVVYAN